ncbi:MAG: cob(I)yrinic acid a,c-diamide adenosyltransferase [Victivallales bacterium]|nr:cob(I)yrinic acid a,c-diamide adenosyltransferase [Victivallales bacterium]
MMLDNNLTKDNAGLLYTVTGDGKGKTTSALGTALRALGRGWNIAILQFIKNDMPTGERMFFTKYFPDVIFESYGLGRNFAVGDHQAAARKGWEHAVKLLKDFDGQLLVLDELNIALNKGLLDVDQVISDLQGRQKSLNVIVTGRYACDKLRAVSDLVSEIQAVKHPFEQGIAAREGLEY